MDSIICSGCIVSGGRVIHSILSPNVRINSWAHVEDSILFENVQIGRHAKVQRAIIDKNVHVPENMEIGFNLDKDRARGFEVTETGIVVIGKAPGIGKLRDIA